MVDPFNFLGHWIIEYFWTKLNRELIKKSWISVHMMRCGITRGAHITWHFLSNVIACLLRSFWLTLFHFTSFCVFIFVFLFFLLLSKLEVCYCHTRCETIIVEIYLITLFWKNCTILSRMRNLIYNYSTNKERALPLSPTPPQRFRCFSNPFFVFFCLFVSNCRVSSFSSTVLGFQIFEHPLMVPTNRKHFVLKHQSTHIAL